jgi:sRNA-binding regulator protein Hfq
LKLDDQYLRDLATWGGPVRIRCREGYLVEDAVVKAVGSYAIVIALPDGEHEELIYKHAIEAIARMPEV